MIFNLIHPSRKRPIQSRRTFDLWNSAAEYPEGSRWICSLDEDDDIQAYINAYSYENGFTFLSPIVSKNKSSVQAINHAANHFIADGEIFIVVSDDTEPCKHWDTKILDLVKDKKDWILKTQDGIQNWIITMPVMDRAYYNRFGYIYHPGYQHLFCDTELTCVADILGRKITSNLLFPHNHYSIGKATLDSVYSKNDRTNEQGEKLFLERYTRNFDLPPGNPIKDSGFINWLKKRNRV